MTSQKQIKREYDKLLKLPPLQENRVNCYKCGTCQHVTKTIDRDHGVIPMFFACEKCGQRASSSFFTDTRPDQEPTIEWYRPSLHETIKLRHKNPALLDHVLRGGLVCKRIDNRAIAQ